MSVAVMLTGVETHRIRGLEVCGLLKPARPRGAEAVLGPGDRIYHGDSQDRERGHKHARSKGDSGNAPRPAKIEMSFKLRQA